MTISTEYLWPLGCLTALGAIHAAYWLEEAVVQLSRRIRRWE